MLVNNNNKNNYLRTLTHNLAERLIVKVNKIIKMKIKYNMLISSHMIVNKKISLIEKTPFKILIFYYFLKIIFYYIVLYYNY